MIKKIETIEEYKVLDAKSDKIYKLRDQMQNILEEALEEACKLQGTEYHRDYNWENGLGRIEAMTIETLVRRIEQLDRITLDVARTLYSFEKENHDDLEDYIMSKTFE